MVSDNRPRIMFRVCPDRGDDGKEQPLMLQHITIDTCERRQDRAYHKCHRCVHQEIARAVRRVPETVIRQYADTN